MSTQSATITLKAHVSKVTEGDIGTAEDRIDKIIKLVLGNGTGDDQANQVFTDTRALADGANETLDFLGGGLLDHFGNALTFSKIKAIIISTIGKGNSTTLLIGAAALPIPFFETSAGDRAVVPPEGFWAQGGAKSGYALGAGATDGLKVTNGAGAAASYDIIVVGVA